MGTALLTLLLVAGAGPATAEEPLIDGVHSPVTDAAVRARHDATPAPQVDAEGYPDGLTVVDIVGSTTYSATGTALAKGNSFRTGVPRITMSPSCPSDSRHKVRS